jgi:hypothetical protein
LKIPAPGAGAHGFVHLFEPVGVPQREVHGLGEVALDMIKLPSFIFEFRAGRVDADGFPTFGPMPRLSHSLKY